MDKDKFSKLTEKEKLNRVLDGTIFWAFLSKPKISEKYKTTKFTLNLGLDEKNQELAKNFGLKVKPADKGTPMPYVEISRKVHGGKTPEEVKPTLVNIHQEHLKDGILIGNTSEGRVKFGTYWFENNGGGVGTSLFKVQVIKLVAFDGSKDRDLVYVEPTKEPESVEFSEDDLAF